VFAGALSPNPASRLTWSALVAAAGFRAGMIPFVASTVAGIVVRNPVTRHVIPWTEMDNLSPGYSGIRIRRTDGRLIVAWAVQKSNWVSVD
jgi:hypothetical protein